MLSWAAPVSDIICCILWLYACVLGRSRIGLSPAPGNSLVVSGNSINVQELKFSIASWGQEWCEEFSFRERVCGKLWDKERPAKSGPDFGSFWGRRQWQSPEGWTTFPHASLASYANETLSCGKRTQCPFFRAQSCTNLVPFFFPLLFTH